MKRNTGRRRLPGVVDAEIRNAAVGFLRVLTITAPVALALAPATPATALEQALTAADGAPGDLFGVSVAIDGDTAAVGASRADRDKGAVYVFTRSGDGWAQTAKLTAADGVTGDSLGHSVAIEGDTLLAGAPDDDVGGRKDQGSVYTFTRTGAAARAHAAKLTAADGAARDSLGVSVAIEGDTLLAGAPGDDVGGPGDQGSVYTFTRTGAAARAHAAKLTAADGAATDSLGSSVAIDGDTIVAGAPGDVAGDRLGEFSREFDHEGSVYTFTRTGAAARSQTAKLTVAGGGSESESLGTSVAIAGDTIVAGAPGDTLAGNALQGSVHTFARTGAADRFATAQLTASDGAPNDGLGTSVAIAGDTIVAGAPYGGPNGRGSTYTFARTGAAVRTPTARLTAGDGAIRAFLGTSMAIDGDTIVTGAPRGKITCNTHPGSVSVFRVPPGAPPHGLGGPARPAVSQFDFPRKITAGRRGRFEYALSAAARVTIVIERRVPLSGRRAAGCITPRRGLKRRGTLDSTGRPGKNTLALGGRINSRPLAPGSYRASITATNAAGTSASRAVSFRVVGARGRR